MVGRASLQLAAAARRWQIPSLCLTCAFFLPCTHGCPPQYDASASVPMIIYDARPGRQYPASGPEVAHPTQLIDIFPTLLTLAEVPAAHWPVLDGRSLTPLFAPASAGNAAPSPMSVGWAAAGNR